MKLSALLLILPAILFSSCFLGGKRIRGNGHVITESRQLTGYEGVEASGSVDVVLTQDSAYSVKVETDENLLPYVIVEKQSGILKIHQARNTNLRATGPLKVYVSGPVLRIIHASGASDINTTNTITYNGTVSFDLSGAADIHATVNAPAVSAEVSGAGTVILKGQTRDLSLDGSGSGDLKCFGLMTENATVDLSGAGSVEVFASVRLKAEVSGAADVRYKGNPEINKHISGAGSIGKAD